ncbi:MAG: acyloxyacyl hydrolase [Gammaproteobacteria bacterium]|nr:acyloxyacyl hydrolase [Gammaproteobacteria bacterium]
MAFEWQEIGLQGGAGSRHGEHFNQWEVTTTYSLPWHWQLGENWEIKTQATASLGILDGEGRQATIFTIGPNFVLMSPYKKLNFEVGINPTWMSKDKFKKVNFGSKFQFTSSLGINYSISEYLIIKIRVQHMSNAGISNHNPGLNQGMLGIGYHF